MGSSEEGRFRKDVCDLNAQFEEWIQEKLRLNKSTSLREGAVEYLRHLKELETQTGFSADSATGLQLGASPYQLTPLSTTKVIHFIRHGQGFHNPPLCRDQYDSRLTAIGWKQSFEVRKHMLQLTTPFAVELVVTSPLTRCLETTTGIFGYEKKSGDSILLKREHNDASKDALRHPKIYKSKNLRIVAQELCRECLSGNNCDRRRQKHVLAEEFPGVDFSKIEYDEDLLGATVKKEWGDPARKRAQSFVKWLMNRPQTHIAVVSHCSFLAFVLQECTSHLKGPVAIKTSELFRNCELRSFVLSRADTSNIKSIATGTSFKPTDV